ncbi:MAG: redoxin domain-containing protein, partial [Myxococcota bacterium]
MAPSLASFLRWKPLSPGDTATALSLTADDGTWIKLPDFKGHLNVLLVFFRSTNDADTDAWLKSIDAARPAFEALDTAVFGVNTARTDQLRAYRARIGTEFFFLYDPLALAAVRLLGAGLLLSGLLSLSWRRRELRWVPWGRVLQVGGIGIGISAFTLVLGQH